MKKKKIGRPPLENADRLKETVSLRLKTDEVDMLRKAAASKGKTFSSWVRDALLDSAHKPKL